MEETKITKVVNWFKTHSVLTFIGVFIILIIIGVGVSSISGSNSTDYQSIKTQQLSESPTEKIQPVEDSVKFNYCECIEGNYDAKSKCDLIGDSCSNNNQESCDVYQHQFADHYCINTCKVKESITDKC